MMLQLEPTIPLETPRGKATAIVLIEKGDEGDLQWVCVHAGGEIWTWRNRDVRVEANVTLGRNCAADRPDSEPRAHDRRHDGALAGGEVSGDP